MNKALAVDFFNTECQTGPHTEAEFGIGDAQGSVAFVDNEKQNEDAKWIATVENPSRVAVTFTAVDGCVFLSENASQRCDAMLTTKKQYSPD